MQWVLTRHRQNTGEWQPPDEDTDFTLSVAMLHAGPQAHHNTDGVT